MFDDNWFNSKPGGTLTTPYHGCLIVILRMHIQTSAPWRAPRGRRLHEEQTIYTWLEFQTFIHSSVMAPLNGPVSLSKQHQSLENKLAIDWFKSLEPGILILFVLMPPFEGEQHFGKYKHTFGNISAYLKSPPLCGLCHHHWPQRTCTGMKGFHGFHLQIGFNLLKQIFSQDHKSLFFSKWDISLATKHPHQLSFSKNRGMQSTIKTQRQLCYLGHLLTYTQLNTDTFEVCRYANDMLIRQPLPEDWKQM